MEIPEFITLYFAKSHVPIIWQMNFIEDEGPSQVKNWIDWVMRSIPEKDVRAQISNPENAGLFDGLSDLDADLTARSEIITRLIANQVNNERIRLLCEKSDKHVLAPYDQEALMDIDVDDDNLVSLKQFELQHKRLERRNYVFELALVLPAENSSYWLKQNLLKLDENVEVAIRLDPLAVQLEEDYREAFYKMWIYGIPLDMQRVLESREEIHGRWIPGILYTPSSFTDVVWSPRGNEVHFFCEEVPLVDDVTRRGSRYFHSILDKSNGTFIHTDGAIRFYSKDELSSRLKVHVRNAGKVGRRIKIFRVDGEIEPEVMGGLASSFFVWNGDVRSYFASDSIFPEDSRAGA